MRTWLLRVALAVPPLLAALWVGGTAIPGSSVWPWSAAGMIDLEVYRRTGTVLLAGGDIFAADGLPWIYPPFAALLTVGFAVLPQLLAGIVWLWLCVAALGAVLYRLGVTGWRLSLLLVACILFVEPVHETLGFGQLGIFLVAAAVLDSMPGRRLLARRILPEGWLTGIATAVKLTPATVAAHNFFAGRRRPGLVAFASFVVATGLAFALLPQASLHYWGALLRGDSGLNSGIIYATNQSVLGVWSRLFGEASRGGLIASGLTLLLGLGASVLLHRRGQARLGLVLAGLTSLLASPISWSHHYVWVVPLGVVLWQQLDLPTWYRSYGLAYVAWVVVAPFKQLPRGDDLELRYDLWQHLLTEGGVVAGVLLLALGVVVARGLPSAQPAQAGRIPGMRTLDEEPHG